jgi:hypothetical protein
VESAPIEIFGVTIVDRQRRIDLDRPFVARFGDIRRVEARGRRVHVELKSGTLFDLDRLNADDLGDGVRVWDVRHGVVDIGERRIQSIEFIPAVTAGDAPARLHGTVRTSQGDFTGFVQWNRQAGVGTDVLHGQAAEGALELRFDTIRSMARSPDGGASVALLDGRVLTLVEAVEIGPANRGIYVDDSRYGRVLVFWEAFESIEFEPRGSGPAYDDFQPGHPLSGIVSTHDGRRLGGRLIFDLDECESTETLDAPSQSVNYTIPFGRIASIARPGSEDDDRRVMVTLHSGEELRLEAKGDLGEGNAGLLIFAAEKEQPDYVPWADVARLDLDRPPTVDPRPIEG